MNLEHRVREGSTKFRVHIHHVVPETDKGTFVSNLRHEVCDHEVGARGFSLKSTGLVSPSNIFVGIQPIFDQITYSPVFAHIRLRSFKTRSCHYLELRIQSYSIIFVYIQIETNITKYGLNISESCSWQSPAGGLGARGGTEVE